MIHSIILFVILIVGCFTNKTNLIWIAFIIFVVQLSLLVHYIITHVKMSKVDLDLLKFTAKIQCSDGPLQMALENFEVEFYKDLTIVKIGLSFTIIGLITFFLILVWGSQIIEWCTKRLEEKKRLVETKKIKSPSNEPRAEKNVESRLERMR